MLARIDPSQSRDAKAVEAARLVVSHAQGEYEQLEKERELDGAGKRELDDGEEGASGGPTAKRAKQEVDDEDEMEIEMEDDDDGEWRLEEWMGWR